MLCELQHATNSASPAHGLRLPDRRVAFGLNGELLSRAGTGGGSCARAVRDVWGERDVGVHRLAVIFVALRVTPRLVASRIIAGVGGPGAHPAAEVDHGANGAALRTSRTLSRRARPSGVL